MFVRLLLLLCFQLLLFNPAFAVDEKGQFAVRTIGLQTCERYVKSMGTDAATFAAFLGWAGGYLTASNQFTKKSYDIIPWGNTSYLATLLDAYCKKYKDKRFYIAVNKLAGTFLKNRIQSRSKLIEVTEGKHKIIIYSATIAKLKTKLKEMGLFKGSVDEKYDAKLRKIVGEFQKDNGLPLTYLPDPVLLHYLFYQRPTTSNK